MRILCILIVIVITTFNVQAQKSDKKGYVGISIGPAFSLDRRLDSYNIFISGNQIEYNPNRSVGLNMNLIDLGYRFGENWGMTFSWFGTGHYRIHKSGSDQITTTTSLGGLLIGPMYSLPMKEDVYLDLKLKVGSMILLFEEKLNDNLSSEGRTSRKPGIEIGSTLRKNLSRNLAVSGNLNLQYMTDFRKTTINLTGGIAYRI